MTLLSPRTFILLAALLCFASAASAQIPPHPEEARQFEEQPPRTNLLQTLGLSSEQIQQIRALHQQRKPQMEAAQQRLREANRALDLAVYADVLDESEVQAKLKGFQEAQAEIARIRFNSETAIRKILTPEQLVRFRELRARAAETRQENVRRRRQQPPGERPIQRLRQLRRQARPN